MADRWQSSGTPQALARLRAWVDQIYRPGFGHLAAALDRCWEQHLLCLYGLDWLMELWSVLYLAPDRTLEPSPTKPDGKPAFSPPTPSKCTSKPPAASTLRYDVIPNAGTRPDNNE